MAKEQLLSVSTKKCDDVSKWFVEVIRKSDLIEYTDVSGCMIFKPSSYQIWEKIQKFLDCEFKKLGVLNSYFPLLISEKLLTKEKEHIDGFAPEVAWVDYGGDTKLKERLAIRPTSETVMYDAYSKWIKSYRDLPLKLNQWNNIVRWEFKHPTPFLRNREFLWQEGHTAFATYKEAEKDVYDVLSVYTRAYEELLCIPVVCGRKSVGEKFAGAEYSLTCEPFCFVSGKSIQACTSHHLGQKFSKVFDITFLDENQKKKYVFQNSWGFSTRSIGSMILIHGDDGGLVLPPKVAHSKLVIIPLFFKDKESEVMSVATEIFEKLKCFNPILDDDRREGVGFKFNKWELYGIPLRLEVGPRDIEKKVVQIVRRVDGERKEVLLENLSASLICSMLEDVEKNMFENAREKMREATLQVRTFEEFKRALENKKRCLVPWAESVKSEEEIKELTGAKSSCIPFEFEKKSLEGVKCFYSLKPATCWAYFCKSY